MKTGDCITWLCDGETTPGIVTTISDSRVTFQTLHGLLSVPLNDGTFKVREDKGLRLQIDNHVKEIVVMATAKKSKAAAKKVPAKTVAKKKVGKVGDGPSKMDLAMDIVRKGPNLTRAQAIAKFIDEAKLTKAGAATYWALVNRKLKKEKAAK